MSRVKYKYPSGKPRGGTTPKPTDTQQKAGKNPKDYHRQETLFHGGEANYERWVEGGRRGY